MTLSPNFSFEELTSSEYALRHGISNRPVNDEVIENLSVLAAGLERARKILGKPIVVTSGYRSPKVNAGVGGSSKSDHMMGLAADIKVPGMTPREVARTLAANRAELGASKLIYEGTWVHISFPDLGEKCECKVMTAIFTPGKATTYVSGIA